MLAYFPYKSQIIELEYTYPVELFIFEEWLGEAFVANMN